ncbi:hypothetical protein [Thioclava nitratireducens]|uniref:hypothetical protein n=1 Tax=Thioclava nitratireducens TaxID=1915078 RepID=UPI00247FB2A6|nr:hypothetical protein [Thioclava nitratireducens]WGT50443.1 hypothetical protein P0N61_19450 [Thioclava nitratireducens]
MDNISQFPPRRDARTSDMESGHLRRAGALRLALSSSKVLNATDRERAAGNLDRLLDELRDSHGLARADIARAAGLGGNGDTDSSKRLDTYTLPPDASEARKNRLAVKAARHFDLANAMARLSTLPEEVLLCRIFEGCSFGVATEEFPDWEQERWSVLARMLTEMARAVIHDTDQKGYWSTVGMMQFPYDFETGAFGEGPYSFDQHSIETGLVNNVVCRDDAPPIPSVPLASRLMAEPTPVVLKLDGGHSQPASLRFCLTFHLALGPVHGLTEIGSMLELRSEIGLMMPDGSVCETSYPIQSTFSLPPKVMLDGEWVQIVAIDGYTEPEPEGRDGAEHHYLGYYEISPALLRMYLTHDVFPTEYLRIVPVDARFPLRFEWGSVGAGLQHDLLDGSLERDLAEVCRSMQADLNLFHAKCRSASLAAEAEAFNRWRRSPPSQKNDA